MAQDSLPTSQDLLGLLRRSRAILDTLAQLVEEGGHPDPSWEAEAVEVARAVRIRLDHEIRKVQEFQEKSQAESAPDLDLPEEDTEDTEETSRESQAVEVLRSLEWSGFSYRFRTTGCPVCRADQLDGHLSGCSLDAALRQEATQGQGQGQGQDQDTQRCGGRRWITPPAHLSYRRGWILTGYTRPAYAPRCPGCPDCSGTSPGPRE